MIRPKMKSKSIWLFLAIVLLSLPLGRTLAADIAVDEDCSLQNAILSANGEEQVEPLNNCEDGDEAVDETQTGSDTITIYLSGTEEGAITLTSTLNVTSQVIIDGVGFVINGDDSYQIFNVDGGSLELMNLTMTAGYSESNGGAIFVNNGSLAMNNSVVSNSASITHGGGIFAQDSDVRIVNSAISGNTAGAKKGVSGAGVYFAGGDENSLEIDKSGFDNNSATDDGAGLYLSSGKAVIKNTTFAQNSAKDKGGAIYNAGTTTLLHVTIVDNSAEIGGGIYDNSLFHLYNSILSNNVEDDCLGTLNSNINNLIADGSCGHGELTGDPMLLQLAGLPIYYVLQDESPAIDGGHPSFCLGEDQRGLERLDGFCDIGAAEYLPGSFAFQVQSAEIMAIAATETAESVASKLTEATNVPPTPTKSTCEALPAGVTVTGYVSGTQCEQRDHRAISNPAIVQYGFKMAIDLWGYVPESGLKICFQDTGSILLFDATTAPRNLIALNTVTEGDQLCARIDRIGLAILMDSSFLTSGLIADLNVPLPDCTVTTTDILNIRDKPAGDTILAVLLNDVSLSASARAASWFKVNYFGTIGWISAEYVTTTGTCQ